MTKLSGGALFTLILTGLVGLFFILTVGLGPTARLVPLVVVIPTFGLLGFQALLDILPSLTWLHTRLEKLDLFQLERFRRQAPAQPGAASEAVGEERSLWRREGAAFFWVLLMLMSIYLLGFLVAVPLYTMFYLKSRSGESWRRSWMLAVAIWGLIYSLFVVVLRARLYEGRLWEWIGG